MSEKKLIGELGEFGIIDRIFRLVAGSEVSLGPGAVGIGDDCAVIPASGLNLVVTTDAMVADRHFDLALSSPADIGHKLITTTLSDIAAMGGRALCLLINVQLPPAVEIKWLDDFYSEADKAAKAAGSVIAGGNTTSANELSFCATAIGVCEANPVLRSGANAGDDLWVSGPIGLSFLGLQTLQGKFERSRLSRLAESAVLSYQRPEARLKLGAELSRIATAMLDVSDGLLQDAGHLAEASGVDLIINEQALPLPELALTDKEKVECMAGGGDYELLFCAPPSQRERLLTHGQLKLIGRAAAPADAVPQVRLLERSMTAEEFAHSVGLAALGHDHFA